MARKLLIVALLAVAAVALNSAHGFAAAAPGVAALIDRDDIRAVCGGEGLTASYATAWDAADERHEVSSVSIGAIADVCDGQRLRVALTDAAGAAVGEGSVVIPAGSATSVEVPMSSGAPAELVGGVDIVISA